MQKVKLDRFVQKYNLNGQAEQVKWKSKDKKLSTSFITQDKSLLGKVTLDNFDFEETELGIYDTAQLKSLLGVLGDKITLDTLKMGDRAISLKIKNEAVSVDFNLSDLSVIPEAPKMKHIPNFGTKIKIDSHFINNFVKGKSALSETDSFTILQDRNNNVNVIIGYSSTNTNRVNIPVNTETCDLSEPISFNAELFKEILIANRECETATLEVSNEGLATINFKVDDYDSTYYMVAIKSVD